MTLNGVIAVILPYFTEFDSFGGRLRHSGSRYTCPQIIVFQLYLAKTDQTQQSHDLFATAKLLVLFVMRVPRTVCIRRITSPYVYQL